MSDESKLPSAVSKEEIVTKILELKKIKALSQSQKNAIQNSNMTIKPNDSKGIITVSFNKELGVHDTSAPASAPPAPVSDSPVNSPINSPVNSPINSPINSPVNSPVTIASGEIEDIVIGGFKTAATAAIENKKYTADVSAILNTASKTTVIADNQSAITPDAVDATNTAVKAALDNLVLDKNGVTPTYFKIVGSEANGTATFRVIYGFGKNIATSDIKVGGFKTNAQIANEAITAEIAKHTGYVKKSFTKVLLKKAFDSPNAIDFSITQPQVPFIIYPKKAKTLTYAFLKATPINTDGSTTVTVNVKSSVAGSKTGIIKFTVGYFTTNQKVVEDIAARLPTTKQNVSTLKANVTAVTDKAFPATLFGITKASLNLPNDADDVRTTITYSHPKIDEDSDVPITFKVTRTKGTYTAIAKKDVVFNVTGLNTAKVNTAIQNLNVNAFNLSVDKNKLASAVNNAEIRHKILALDGIKNFTDIQKSLIKEGDITTTQNDDTGYITVTVNNHRTTTEPNKEFTITGFKTNKDVVNTAIQNLDPNNIALFGDKNKLPSAIDDTAIKTAMEKLLASIKAKLTQKQQDLIQNTDITITKIDDTGDITVTINNSGGNKEFIITGFKTNKDVVDAAIQNLDPNDIALFGDDTKLASVVTNAEIRDKILASNGIKNLTDIQKNLIKEGDITTTQNDDTGYITVTVNNHRTTTEPNKEFIITGFKTNKDVVDIAIRRLSDKDFNTHTDTTKLPSAVTNAEIRNKILAVAGIVHLTAPQQSLIKEGDITTTQNDDTGYITVTIKNHGRLKEPNKKFTIPGFKTNKDVVDAAIQGLKADKDFKLSGYPNKLPSTYNNDTTKSTILRQLKDLPNRLIASLSETQKKLIVANDITLNSNDAKGTLTFTIKNHGDDKEFTITGFKTNTDADTVNAAIQNLPTKAFDFIDGSGYLPSKFDQQVIYNKIKDLLNSIINTDLNGLKANLASPDKKLINYANDIKLTPNDDAGKLLITIKNHGTDKIFTITGTGIDANKNTIVRGNVNTIDIAPFSYTSYIKAIELNHSLQLGIEKNYTHGFSTKLNNAPNNWQTSDPEKLSVNDKGVIKVLSEFNSVIVTYKYNSNGAIKEAEAFIVGVASNSNNPVN